MKRLGTFNPTVEDILLWAWPVSGHFSFLNPFGTRQTMQHRYDGDWRVMEAKRFMSLVLRIDFNGRTWTS